MTFSAFLYTYIFGGLTFVPLLLAAILVPAWYFLPQVQQDGRANTSETSRDLGGGPEQQESKELPEGAASATFIVLRKYDWPAALAVLNARANANNAAQGAATSGAGATGEVNNAADGASGGSEGSVSVYQSMYRSVFDRKNPAGSATSILENEDASSAPANTRAKRKVTPVNVFYIVLRHGHLMLYDDDKEKEVRHVISLAHHNVSLTEGTHDEETLKDADLFIKRTAIVLTPNNDLPNGSLQGPTAPPKRPYYFFSSTCIEKEDFYHALLYTRTSPPIPQPLETDAIIKLQSTLHSNSALTPETRAFNALVSRVFLAVHQTDRLKTLIRQKIEKKISRVQKPAFIASLAVQSIDLGDAAPVLSNPRLKDLNISGDMTVAFDVKYTGGLKLTVSAVAQLDLGPRFKTRTADLVLASSVQRLQGHMLVRIKPPPSNRIWFCFESVPEMDIKVEPVVSQRQITYTFILRAIEDRIRSVIGETLVRPNWDDVPFFGTKDQYVRGGIWKDEGIQPNVDKAEEERPAGDVLKDKNEKTKSMPALVDGGESSANSSGSENTSKTTSSAFAAALQENPAELKRRSVASLPAQLAPTSATSTSEREVTTPPRPLRSPSTTTPLASVHLDESPANAVEPGGADASGALPKKTWRIRPQTQQSIRKDAIETMREMRDRNLSLQSEQEKAAEDESGLTAEPSKLEHEGDDGDEAGSRRASAPSSGPFSERSMRTPKRADTNVSTATSSSATSARGQQAQQRGKNMLAAAGAATMAARNWGWNAIATRTNKGGARGGVADGGGRTASAAEPMGRGQPLPPPGVPLPGPQKGWLPAGMTGSVKRKPVLPPRRSVAEGMSTSEDEKNKSQVSIASVESTEQERGPTDEPAPDSTNSNVRLNTSDLPIRVSEDVATPASEFGPWRENSGAGLEGLGDGNVGEHEDSGNISTSHAVDEDKSAEEEEKSTAEVQRKKVPPPLPSRPKPFAPHNYDTEEMAKSSENAESAEDNSIIMAESEESTSNLANGDEEHLSVHDFAETVQADERSDLENDTSDVDTAYEHSEPSNVKSDNTQAEEEDLVAIPAPVDDAFVDSADDVEEIRQATVAQRESVAQKRMKVDSAGAAE